MTTTLVTGAAGNLGAAVVGALLERDHQVHAHMRSQGAAIPAGVRAFHGDIRKGEELPAASFGVDAIIHCASFFDPDGATDREGARNLIRAAKANGAPHLVYISIVGVDRTPFPYFKTKLEVEKIVEDSGLPHTILRATQFHSFVLRLISGFEDADANRIALPAGLNFQSIAVEEVAAALVKASERDAAGRLPDIAGPRAYSLEEMTLLYCRLSGKERTITSLTEDPQRDFHDSFRDGRNLAPDHAVGRITWEEFLRQQAR